MSNKKRLIIVVIFAAAALAYYIFFTAAGAKMIVKSLIRKYAAARKIEIKSARGSLAGGFLLQDVNATGIRGLPEGSELKIQKFSARMTSLSPGGLNFEIFNARLNIAGVRQVLFQGNCKKGALDLNIYAQGINLAHTLGFFSEEENLKFLSGELTGLDAYIKGPSRNPEISGDLLIESLSYKGFSASDCPVVFKMKIEDLNQPPRIKGEAVFGKGEISGPKTARIRLERSTVYFLGDLRKPGLNIKGNAAVGKYIIRVALTGTPEKPEIMLTSEPQASQSRLLVMLATGKSWSGTEEALKKGELSVDLAKDFVDYFFFGGAGSKLSEQYGIDVSVQYANGSRKVGVKKSISEKAQITYSTEQSQAKAEDGKPKQKIGGEYQVAGGVSVGAEKEIAQTRDNGQDTPEGKEQETDDS
ncbi:translocation/assembly module TamB domain-containing protein, partial [Candidatus Omnitrophota bacterium]